MYIKNAQLNLTTQNFSTPTLLSGYNCFLISWVRRTKLSRALGGLRGDMIKQITMLKHNIVASFKRSIKF